MEARATLGPLLDRAYGVFRSPHPRFRELDFCQPFSGSSTATLGQVDAFLSQVLEEEDEEEVVEDDVKTEDVKESSKKEAKIEMEEEEEEEEEDMSSLTILKEDCVRIRVVEKKESGSEEEGEEEEEVEKPGPRIPYTPQEDGAKGSLGAAEVGCPPVPPCRP